MSFAPALIRRWQGKAAELERYGAIEAARTHLALAAELEQADRKWWSEVLTAKQAAEFAGVSESTAYRWKREIGELTRAKVLGASHQTSDTTRDIVDALDRVIALRGSR